MNRSGKSLKTFKIVVLVAVLQLVLIALTVAFISFTRHELRKKYEHPPIVSIDNWKRFTSEEGNFSVFFPSTPKTTSVISDLPTTNVEIHLFYVNANKQNAFAVGYSDNPMFAKMANLSDPQNFLKMSQFLTISNCQGKVVYERDEEFRDYTAREFEYAAGGKANYSVRMKYVLAGERFYEMYVVFLTTAPCPQEQLAFF